jgi:DNA-binding Xre family transcriptional regulator
MENFFYNDCFCVDMEDLADIFDINEDNVNKLKDDWQVRIELSDLEPIFNVNAESLCQLLAAANDERLSENFNEKEKVLKALKEAIDFDKLKNALPKLYYPNNRFEIITKADLVKWFS